MTESNVEPFAQNPRRSLTRFFQSVLEKTRRDRLVLSILGVIFLARIPLGDRSSFWLDELISVYLYGTLNPSLSSAIGALAESSIHPPAYQVVLWPWMQVFGSSEAAVRSLSALFLSLAGYVVYLIVRRELGPTFSTVVASLFAVGFLSSHYALEARNYAMVIFLSSVSSMLFLESLRFEGSRSKRYVELSLLFAVNSLLLLTHYFSFFFLAAQGIFFLLVLLTVPLPAAERWRKFLEQVLWTYFAPAVLFLAIWGAPLARSLDGAGARFSTDNFPTMNPAELWFSSVFQPNFRVGDSIFIPAFLLFIAAFAFVALWRPELNSRSGHFSLIGTYLGAWSFFPFVFVYLFYFVFGFERYESRYFIFSWVPLVPFLVMALKRGLDFLTPVLTWPLVRGLLLAIVWVVAATSTIPILIGGYVASTSEKSSYREIAQNAHEYLEDNDGEDFVVREVGSSNFIQFYFDKLFDTAPRVLTTLDFYRASVGGGDYSPEQLLDGHDKLLLLFVNERPRTSDDLMEFLGDYFTVIEGSQDGSGRGYLVLQRALGN